MQMLIDPLNLSIPLAAFNGGEFVWPDLTLIEQHVLFSNYSLAALLSYAGIYEGE
jgi:hypothetical protein